MADRPDRFLRALRGEPVDATPVWFMRQAGRYLPEYRAIREEHDFLTMVKTPEIAAEITLQPLRRFDLDAAVIYSDLLPPLETMGLGLRFAPGVGPVIDNPITTTRDVDLLATPPAGETMPWTPEAIRLVKAELAPKGIPVLGFAGAPFTLAAYAIEGGGSKRYEKTRVFMYNEPAAWRRLMEKLVTVAGSFLAAQAAAGADALQVFDSWAGALSRYDYERYAAPYTATLIEAARRTGLPVIHFTTGTAGHLDAVAAAGGDAIGVDAGPSLQEAHARVGGRPLQGNLDPYLLQAPWRELKAQADRVLAEAPATGHVFNTGHGLVPSTPPDAVARLTDYVHETTSETVPA
ncbi:MAG: uroporphyrinogen decarboxylase [Rubricoccaceae bacterium]|nr:uroporphyrinogen decarboxylase [Rubricoccaceae bacterium]